MLHLVLFVIIAGKFSMKQGGDSNGDFQSWIALL